MTKPIANHVLGIDAFSRVDIEDLFADATRLENLPAEQKRGMLVGRLVVSMFFEPSTRTRISFESAALRLGASVTGFSDAHGTSSAKGESLEDTVRMCASYGDALVLRHPLMGAAKRAAAVSAVPIINAGDGAGEHPTQTLVDLYTILREKGRLDGLHIGIAGDLCYGRTVHSLLLGLAKFRNIKVSWFSPAPALRLPESQQRHATLQGIDLQHVESLAELAGSVDVLYMTRIQHERFDASESKVALDSYVLRAAHVKNANPNACIIHPLPRVKEIATEVDLLPNAAYFRQAQNAIPVRQALLCKLLPT
jgi:aspartate carbamoyltransferase catalytic subunit